jgi:methionyl-tRNA synthetase
MNLLGRANKYIEEMAPWALAKDETKVENLKSVMAHLAYIIFVASKLFEPVLVTKTSEIYTSLGIDGVDFDDLNNVHYLDGKQVTKGALLFPRLDVKAEVEYIQSLMIQK